jgi:hypothetical protein
MRLAMHARQSASSQRQETAVRHRYQSIVSALAALTVGACSTHRPIHDRASDGDIGSVGLQLELGAAGAVDSVHYDISGPDAFATSGDIAVSGAAAIRVVVADVPAGNGYQVALSAATLGEGTTCSGSASFNVQAHATTSVRVHVQCRKQPRTGTVSINGDVNVCPVIASLAAVPDQILVGGSTDLLATAGDPDNVPRALQYQWTTTAGALSSATSRAPTLTVHQPGAATVTLTVSDGDCTDTWSVDVTVKRPNILLLVADDLGYSDLAAFGGEIATPNLDALAAGGRIITDHHSGALCAPTRSMLISGTDHHQVGLGRQGAGTGTQAGQPGYEGYLNDRAVSVAELLRDAGYHTYIAGKWHLGNEAHQTPLRWGYESSYVLLPGVQTHFNEFADPPTASQARQYRENGEFVVPPRDFYSTNFYTDRLIGYIDAHRGDGKPFYAFAAYTSPHWPMQAPDDVIDRYRAATTRATRRSATRGWRGSGRSASSRRIWSPTR